MVEDKKTMEGKYESQARVVELATLLKTRAPSVAPNVAPRPYKHATSNILTLCTTPKQRADAEAYLAAAVEREERVQGEGGSRPEEQEENEAKHVVVTSETDIGTRTFRITAAKLAGKVDATLHDLERLMELHLNADQETMEPYVNRFSSANALGADVAAASALQEVCSLAYALRIAASNMPGCWTGYVGSFKLPLGNDVDMTSVLRELFEPPPPSPSPTSPKPSGKKKKGARGNSNNNSKDTEREEGQAVGKGKKSVAGKGAKGKQDSDEKSASRGSKRKKK